MSNSSFIRNRRAGFSLVQISIILTVAAIIAAALLPGGDNFNDLAKQQLTVYRMVKIEEAMRGFRAANGYIPCPADGSIAVGAATFGSGAGSGTGTCTSVNFGPTSNVVAGVIPTRTLALPDELMLDGWGRRMTYVVDQRDTVAVSGGTSLPTGGGTLGLGVTAGSSLGTWTYTAHGLNSGDAVYVQNVPANPFVNASTLNGGRIVTKVDANTFTTPLSIAATGTMSGTNPASTFTVTKSASGCAINTANSTYGITINLDSGSTTAMVALISHGKNGHGAFPARGSTVAGRINSGSTDADEWENASVLDGSFATNFNTTFVKKRKSNTFDDILRYGRKCREQL